MDAPKFPAFHRWPVTIRFHSVVLAPFRVRDVREVAAVRARNTSWLSPWDATSPVDGSSLPSPRSRVRQMWAQARQGKTLPWVLRLDDHPAIIGQCTVSNIVYGSVQSGSIGYWIDHNHAGRSLMPLAVALATDYAMTVVGLHRIEVCIRPENAASLRVMDKLGFRYEGRREKYIHINGHWCDHDVFVLTADEVGEGVVSRLS